MEIPALGISPVRRVLCEPLADGNRATRVRVFAGIGCEIGPHAHLILRERQCWPELCCAQFSAAINTGADVSDPQGVLSDAGLYALLVDPLILEFPHFRIDKCRKRSDLLDH